MTQVPLVSVIMPAYNAESTIGASISGVLTQTHERVELIIVDDGSTDGTSALCRAYGDQITYVRQENAGSATARNRALSLAAGNFIAFCDSDDVLLSSYLEKALATYHAAGAGRRLVMNDALLLTSTGLSHGRRLVGGHYPRRNQRLAILQKNFVPILSIFPREMYEEIGGFSAELRYCEDWEFWIRAIIHGWQVSFQPEPQALYRLSPNAKTALRNKRETEDAVIDVVRRAQWDKLTTEERAFLDLRLTVAPPGVLDEEARVALRAQEWKEARGKYRQLLMMSSGDTRVRARAMLMSYVPGAMWLWRQRQLSIDKQMGGRIQAPDEPVQQPK